MSINSATQPDMQLQRRTLHFKPQSYRGEAFSLEFASDLPLTNVRLSKVESGNLTHFIATPGGNWHIAEISFSGEIKVSSHSVGKPILALANQGNWSGGGNYKGFVAGKSGDIVFFDRKGQQKWLVFNESGFEWKYVNPGAKPVEIN